MSFRAKDPATACYKVLFTYLCGVCVHLEVRDSLKSLVFSFYHTGLRDGAQINSLDGKCLYPLSHLTGPYYDFDISVKHWFFSTLVSIL